MTAMLNPAPRWSHARGNTVVPSRWRATDMSGEPGIVALGNLKELIGWIGWRTGSLCINDLGRTDNLRCQMEHRLRIGSPWVRSTGNVHGKNPGNTTCCPRNRKQ